MRDIKFEIMFWVNNRDFTTSIAKHYTTINRLTNGQDTFDYDSADIVAKRQFTDLQDKSGVDIYEGDIVEPMDKYSDWLTKGYVVFEHGSFVIKALNPFFTKSRDQLTAHSNKYKVIGNIHENPELLESNNAK